MKLLNCTYHLLLVSAFALLLASISDTPVVANAAADDKARSFSKEWKSTDLSPISSLAKSLQLSWIGFKAERDISEWLTYYNETVAPYLNMQKLDYGGVISKSPIAPLIHAFIAGIFLAFAVPIFGVIWLLFRRCNWCGGHKPNKDGYKAKQIMVYSLSFVFIALLNIVIACIFIVYSYQTTSSLINVKSGLDGFANSVVLALNDTAAGLEQTPDFNQAMKEIAKEIKTGPMNVKINETFADIVNDLEFQLKSLDGVKFTMLITLNKTDSLLQNITDSVNRIPVKATAIGVSINSLQIVTINGVNYPIQGFPDVSGIINSSSPDLSGIPNVKSYIKTVQDIPNVAALANDVRSNFDNLPDIIASSFNDSSINLNGGSTNISSNIRDMKTQMEGVLNGPGISSAYELVLQYDSYRSYGFLAQMMLIIVPALFAVIAVGFKKRIMMNPFCSCALILSFIIWIQFVVFYLVSAPPNVICNSKNKILAASYSLPSNGFANITIRPQTLINECTNGKKIFNANLSASGGSFLSIAENLMTTTIDKSMNDAKLDQKFKFPNMTATLSIDTSAINNFNTSNIGNMNLNMNFNITKTVLNIRTAMTSFSPSSIDANYGNMTRLQLGIDSFNEVAKSYTSSLFNYSYIVNTYVIPGKTFKGENVTRNSSDTTNNARLESAFYGPEILLRTTFIYNANLELDRVKAGLENNIILLNNLENVDIHTINMQKQNITVYSNSLGDNKIQMVIIIDNIKVNSGAAFTSAIDSFVKWTIRYVIDLIKSELKSLIESMFLNNPVPGFGTCGGIAKSMTYLLDGVCDGIVSTFSGLWLMSLLLGAFLAIGFVVALLTKKRIAFVEDRGSAVSDKKQDHEKGPYVSSSDDYYDDADDKYKSNNRQSYSNKDFDKKDRLYSIRSSNY